MLGRVVGWVGAGWWFRRACWAATRVWVVRWRKTKRYNKNKRNRNGFSVRLGIWVGKIRFQDRSWSWISRNLNSWFLLFLKENTIQIGMCNSKNWKERETKVRSGTIWERAYLRQIDKKKEQREPVESDHSKRERERERESERESLIEEEQSRVQVLPSKIVCYCVLCVFKFESVFGSRFVLLCSCIDI